VRFRTDARLFFDVFDGEKLWTDTEGTDHADMSAARHEAIDTITSMSRETFPLNGASFRQHRNSARGWLAGSSA